jgi:hypothetical protein
MTDREREEYADSLRALNAGLLTALEEEKEKIDQRRADAKRVLAQCDTEDDHIEEKRNSIIVASKMQLAYLSKLPEPSLPPCPVALPQSAESPAEPDQSAPDGSVQKRARVGPQRYLMLTALRGAGPLTVSDIVNHTGLLERRVRDQLRADMADGVVKESLSGTIYKYGLTEPGLDLLDRFERYRRHTGKGLPTRAEALADNRSGSMYN